MRWLGWVRRLGRVLTALVLPSFTLIAAACGSAGGSGAAPGLEDLPPIPWTEELRIGSLDDPVLGFSQIAYAVRHPDGNLYVLEAAARELRVFDGEGRRLRTFGRPGSGPGEFDRVGAFGFLHDTVWIVDPARKVAWFAPDGSLVTETPLRARLPVDVGQPGAVTLSPLAPGPDGLIRSVQGFSSNLMASIPDSFEVPDVRFDRSGAVHDTVGWRTEYAALPPFVRIEGRAVTLRPSLVARPPLHTAVLGDSVRIDWSVDERGTAGTLEVTRLDAAGRVVYRQRLVYRSRALTRAYADSVVGRYVQRAPAGERGAVERAVRALLDFPSHHPPFSSRRVGQDGTLWLQIATAAPADTVSWILIGPEGDLRGRLTLPARLSIFWSDRHTVWTIDRDEFQVPWLVRLGLGG